MKHSFSPDRSKLFIHVDEVERKELRKLRGKVQHDQTMYEFLEPLTCNSELEWLPEGATGDLTSAPMLGILGDEEPYTKEMDGTPHISTGPNLVQTIDERWAFMSYQVRSVLEDLRDNGVAIFVS